MNDLEQLEESHAARSDFVRKLIQDGSFKNESNGFNTKIPKIIVQFWDNKDYIPNDVLECISSWKKTEAQGIERLLFSKSQARNFIAQKLGLKYQRAYDKCYHPAMQSDYFRLCYIYFEGGCYIDADDVYDGSPLDYLFNDGRLKLQPLCYDVATHSMVPSSIFTKKGSNSPDWIFYFNNNPIIASQRHPVIKYALDRATQLLEETRTDVPEIQATTGPGNLTKSIFDTITNNTDIRKTLFVLNEWESIAQSNWELSYRNDIRNWRLSNCQPFNDNNK